MWVQLPLGPQPNMHIISDNHFGHANIIKYCSRPFATTAEMDAVMTERWNGVVGKDGDVLHLGDFGFHYGSLFDIRHRLNGRIKFVVGNHDYSPDKMARLGLEVVCAARHGHYEFTHNGRVYVAAHRPIDLPRWTPEDRRVRLCGHEHNNTPIFIRWCRDKHDVVIPICAFNMSVELWNYTPVHIDEVTKMWDETITTI